MTTGLFDPLAVELDIRLLKKDVKTIITEFFDAIVNAVATHQPDFLGHLKGFCKGSGDDYLQISYVSAQTGVQVNGQWEHNPESVRLTLNIILAGIDHSRIKAILDEILSEGDFQRMFSYKRLALT